MKIDWPLDSNIIRRSSLNNTFGMVRLRADKSPRPHQGWDFYAPTGTPCYSVADGLVVYADSCGDLGKLIVIEIDKNLFVAYAHLSEIFVKTRNSVKLGDMIGKTGCTGNADKMQGEDQHLHFEVRETPLPGLGLDNRKSPLSLFGVCPLKTAIKRRGV